MSCVTSTQSSRKEVHGLKLEIRDLRNKLEDFAMRTNSCGEIDDCSVEITNAVGGGGVTAVTWSSFLGLTYKVEKSIDQETWTVVTEAYPATGETTTFNVVTPTVVTYYRVTENPSVINVCS